MYTQGLQKVSESFNMLTAKYNKITRTYEAINKKYDEFCSKVLIPRFDLI